MKERPILFSGAMVRAILAGTKWQTRRVLNPQPDAKFAQMECHRDGTLEVGVSIDSPNHYQVSCPYGAVGDRLWVRETFVIRASDRGRVGVLYRADGVMKAAFYDDSGAGDLVRVGRPLKFTERPRWNPPCKPSIFMPRAACRIVLEILEVRVQRLQEISVTDAIAEGMNPADGAVGEDSVASFCGQLRYAVKDGKASILGQDPWPVRRYKVLWDQLNAKRGFGWMANPWVWAITFKRV
jgi:hypothetical protein